MSIPHFDRLGWTEDNYCDIHGYYLGMGQRIGMWLHVMRASDSGPGAVSLDAICGGLQGVCLVGIRRDTDTHHTQAKHRVAPHPTAQAAIDAGHPRRSICPRCIERAPRAKEATR